MMTNSLTKLDQATRMRAEIHRIDDAKDLMNLAEAARVYAKQVELGLEAQNHAAEIKARAQRRAGELLDSMDKAKGAMGTGSNQYQQVRLQDETTPPTYAEMGITKRDAHVWQTIARMPEEEFEQVILKAIEGKREITTAGIYREARKEQDPATPPIPDDKYNVIYADPPWKYKDELILEKYGPSIYHYPSMSINELCELPIKELASENAVLFIWVTSPLLEDVFKVIRAWGFEYKASFVWDKVKHNYGHYNSVRHEFLLICTRGSCTPEVKELYDSVQSIPRTDRHSEKPEEFRGIIEKLYPNGKYIELFARTHIAKWDVWGNEAW